MREISIVVLILVAFAGLGWLLSGEVGDPIPQTQTAQVVAAGIPDATGHVNDSADMISDSAEVALEADLREFKPEIAVLTVQSLGGLSIEEYGIKVADKWRVGSKEEDDGVILIISKGDKKARIEVGYGSESKINDAKAGRILDENIIPYFKQGDWEGGILSGVTAIIAALK